MSHSTVLVLTRPGTTFEQALAPFDENTTVEPYIESTRAELIAAERARHAEAAANLEKFLADPQHYFPGPEGRIANPAHLRWIIRDAPAREALSDDELFTQHVAALWSPRRDERSDGLDADGNYWSTYNPKSKWDWYAVGGRWDLHLTTHQGVKANVAALTNIDWKATEPTFAVLTPDGAWHERGRMGWFGIVSDAQDDWPDQFRAVIAAVENPAEVTATLVDVHI